MSGAQFEGRRHVSFRADSYALCVADAMRVMEAAGVPFAPDWLPALHTRNFGNLANFVPADRAELREKVRDQLRTHDDFSCRDAGAGTLCAQELLNADALIAAGIAAHQERVGAPVVGVVGLIDDVGVEFLPTQVTVTDLINLVRVRGQGAVTGGAVLSWDVMREAGPGARGLTFECWTENTDAYSQGSSQIALVPVTEAQLTALSNVPVTELDASDELLRFVLSEPRIDEAAGKITALRYQNSRPKNGKRNTWRKAWHGPVNVRTEYETHAQYRAELTADQWSTYETLAPTWDQPLNELVSLCETITHPATTHTT